MVYLVSDLHGEYFKFIKLLKKIRFSPEDKVYILGDIMDRGKWSAELFRLIMNNKNIIAIKGNHEEMAEKPLAYLLDKYPDGIENIKALYYKRELSLWFVNGGDNTVLSFYKSSRKERERILSFIKYLPYYKQIEVNCKKYVLVHGGLGYEKNAKIENISRRDMLWTRPDFDSIYLDDDTTVIVGHTPTFFIKETYEKAKIYRGKGNVIAIDCGVAYPEYGGRLGCLCLDTGEEFYV